MANPYSYPDYDFRWTQRWEKLWPTILARVNSIMEKLDWCKWEIENKCGAEEPDHPAYGYYDDPLQIGGAYIWHDPGNHVFRVSETLPSSITDGVEVGMGETSPPDTRPQEAGTFGDPLKVGLYDDPLQIGAGYIWFDPGRHVFRVSEGYPDHAADGVEVSMGEGEGEGGGGVGGTPEPRPGGYLWYDPDNHVFRVAEGEPATVADGIAIGTGGTA